MSESLKQKIRKKAYTLNSIYVDDVMELIDRAIVEIEAKAFRKGVEYWENVVMVADVKKILLGEENQK